MKTMRWGLLWLLTMSIRLAAQNVAADAKTVVMNQLEPIRLLTTGLASTSATADAALAKATSYSLLSSGVGSMSVAGTLTATLFIGAGAAPTLTMGAGAGSNPTAVSVSDATTGSGYLSFITGSLPTTGKIATVTFAASLPAGRKPKVLLEGISVAAVVNRIAYMQSNISLMGFDIVTVGVTPLPANSQFTIAYTVSQ